MFVGSWRGFCGVTVSTLDFESKDPSSNLGRTSELFLQLFSYSMHLGKFYKPLCSNYIV